MANAEMGFLARRSPTARRNGMRELLDGAAYAPDELAANLREIRILNRRLGWTRATLRLVEGIARETGLLQFSHLDVATGSSDLPLALSRLAARRGWTVRTSGLDASAAVLEVARAHLGTAPVTLHQGDARALPFADRSFDVLTCALALHHFAPDDAVLVLRELARVARVAWVVVDLDRSLPAYLGARALAPVVRSRLTRHDAPASVLRAYTRAELRDLLWQAGITDACVATQFPFRLVAYGRNTG